VGDTEAPQRPAPGERALSSEGLPVLGNSVHSLASNPNAAAFDQVHVFKGGRW
jgi:hypothetical protein